MKRLVCPALLLGLMVAFGASNAADDTPSIKDIMTKAHKKGDGLVSRVGEELKGATVPWDDVQKQAKELLDLGKALGKNTPRKGEKASWEKLTSDYVQNAVALNDAAQKKDKEAATAAHGKLAKSCAGCHKAHKGK